MEIYELTKRLHDVWSTSRSAGIALTGDGGSLPHVGGQGPRNRDPTEP